MKATTPSMRVRYLPALALSAIVAAAPLGAGCLAAFEPPPEGPASPLAVGETRVVELRSTRFDVLDYEKTLTKADILALPADVQARLWLLDLDLSNGPNAPRLLDNALAAIRTADPKTLTPAARNLQRLLNMTPATADLRGTNLEELNALAPLIGIAPPRVLADLLAIDVDDEFIAPALAAEAILTNVIATHPNARTRLGAKTAANPDGIYPVARGSIPITLADAATNCASLSTKFGAVTQGGVFHPGFIVGTTSARVLEEDFRITVRANANALPYKGIELARAEVASVSSVRSQSDRLFNFEDPNWLVIDGLVPGVPVLESITFRIPEHPEFVRGGRSPMPRGFGSSEAWTLPPWSIEHVLISAAQSAYRGISTRIAYTAEGKTDPLFEAVVSDGFQEMNVAGGVGAPPAPSYLWDLLLEVAQVRLHDGQIPEGQADVEITLRDVPIGTDTATIERSIRENLEADPNALADLAATIIDNASGDADLYYYRASRDNAPERQGDWLFFVAEGDLPRDEAGRPKRPYSYARPGFFADAELTQKVSTKDLLDGDTEHEKVRIDDATVVYAEGLSGVYRLEALPKKSLYRRSVFVTRIR